MGGLLKSLTPETPQAPEPPKAAPPAPKLDDPQVQKAATEEREKRAGKGRASTILTDPFDIAGAKETDEGSGGKHTNKKFLGK